MTDDSSTSGSPYAGISGSSGSASGGPSNPGKPAETGPRRPRATLDLTATEVKAAEAGAGGEAGRPQDPPAGPGARAREGGPDKAGAPSGPEKTGPSSSTGQAASAETPSGPDHKPRAQPDGAAPARPVGHWPSLLAAGSAGAVLAVLALAGLWAILWAAGMPLPTTAGTAPAVDTQRLAAIEAQLAEVARQAAAPSAAQDGAQLQETVKEAVKETVNAALAPQLAPLAERLARLESAPPAGADPTAAKDLSERLAALAAAVKALESGRSGLDGRLDEIAAAAGAARDRAEAAGRRAEETAERLATQTGAAVSRDDITTLDKRIAAAEAALANLRKDVAARAADATDRAGRLAITAAALREAVLRGAPFAAELEAVRRLDAPDDAVAALAPQAETGVPSTAALARDFAKLAPELRKAAGAPAAQGNFIERLQANAATLVRIRPADAPAGDDPRAAAARLDLMAERLGPGATPADLDAVLADLARLPAEARAPAEGWIARAGQRRRALDAADRIAAAAREALAAAPQQGTAP